MYKDINYTYVHITSYFHTYYVYKLNFKFLYIL